MKNFKLEDIEKREPFKAPQGYFDQLPMRVQMRLGEKARLSPFYEWYPSLKWGIPALGVMLLAMGYFFVSGPNEGEAKTDLLETVAAADLTYFLEQEPISTYWILETAGTQELADSLWVSEETSFFHSSQEREEETTSLYEQFEIIKELL